MACKEIGLKVASFIRDEEPQGVSTMEWGVGDAIQRSEGVPDVIFDTGGIGKEAMIRLLGTDAVEVVKQAFAILSAMMR